MPDVPLPGDLIAGLIAAGTGLLPDRERGNLDPQTVAEFLAYDVPFALEPSTRFVFPEEVERG